MKKSAILASFLLPALLSFSQGNSGGNSNSNNGVIKWNINGNNADSSDFLGTNNNQDLLLKTNSIEAIRITTDQNAEFAGDVYLKNEINPTLTESRYMLVTSNGKLVSVSKSGLLGAIYSSSCGVIGDNGSGTLYESPTWESIPISQQFGYLVTGVDCPARVGIGTPTPGYQLHVEGAGYFTGTIGLGSAPVTSTQINSYTNRKIGMSIEHNYAYGTGYVIKGVLHNINTVGLGIVNGNSNSDVFNVFGDGRTIVGPSNNTNSMLNIYNTGYTNGINVYHNNSTQGNAALFLNTESANGLAIRVKNNSSSLDVFRVANDGNVWATEINVALSSDFPDYVFTPSYNLLSFNELRNYIYANGHLPNFQSADHYKQSGMNMSEMHIKEIEKIEELTRYILLLEERLSKLEQEKELK